MLHVNATKITANCSDFLATAKRIVKNANGKFQKVQYLALEALVCVIFDVDIML